jgi:hypothetical protein
MSTRSPAPPFVARVEAGGPPRDARRSFLDLDRGLVYATVGTLLTFLVLALLLAATRPPQSDEGHFANAGAALATQGRFVMPMWTTWISTLDQRVYSNMPLYFVTLGAWFKAFGVSWMTFRALSVLFGLIMVTSLLATVRSITRERTAFVAALVFVALNYDLVNLSSARYDVMTAALSWAGIASYLGLRERSLDKAVLVANTLLAAACMTHPFAVFGMVGLATFALVLDRRAIRPRHIALAAAPYLVALAAWGVYIAKDPAMFRAQFAENASGRLQGRLGPLGMLSAEIRQRYIGGFAGWRPGAPPLMRVKILVLLAYAVGLVGCLALPRTRSNPKARALALFTVFSVLLLTVADAHRWYVYLIYVLPQLSLCLALFTEEVSRMGTAGRWTARVGLAAFALFTVASVGYRARLDVHHRAFLPAVAYLQSHLHRGDLVIAGGEFGMGLDFEQHVLDDPSFGYRSHRAPTYVVLSTDSRERLAALTPTDSASGAYVKKLLGGMRPVFESSAGNVSYEVFATGATATASPASAGSPK